MHTVGPNGDVTVEKKGRDGSCSAPTAPAVHKHSSGKAGAVTRAGSVCEKLSSCLFMHFSGAYYTSLKSCVSMCFFNELRALFSGARDTRTRAQEKCNQGGFRVTTWSR